MFRFYLTLCLSNYSARCQGNIRDGSEDEAVEGIQFCTLNTIMNCFDRKELPIYPGSRSDGYPLNPVVSDPSLRRGLVDDNDSGGANRSVKGWNVHKGVSGNNKIQ